MLDIMALASALKTKFWVAYPECNKNLRPLISGIVEPLSEPSDCDRYIYLLWSRDGNLDSRPWVPYSPNHFIPIIPRKISPDTSNLDIEEPSPKEKMSEGQNDERPYTLNKRGQVRPKIYNSKFKRLKTEHTRRTDSTCLASTSSTIDNHYGGIMTEALCNETVSMHDYQTESPVQEGLDVAQNDTSTMSVIAGTDENDETNINNFSSSDKSECTETNVSEETLADEVSSETLADDLISFIKQKESVSLEDLLAQTRKDLNIENDDTAEDEPEVCNIYDMTIDEDGPILPGHWMSLKTCVLLVWLYSMTHSLTAVEITDLLTLVNLLTMECSPVFKSLYRFKRFFQMSTSPFVKHFYCSICSSPVSETQESCPNDQCGKDLKTKNAKAYFLELPIKTQLKSLFSRHDFRMMLKHRRDRIKLNDKNIEDVYDSDKYKALGQKGGPLCLEKENNMSFTFNTDGIPIFKSSKMSMWPIFLMVNELPFRKRKYRENMLLCGLWFGPSKPVMNLFCNPLHDSLLELERGITLSLETETIDVQGFLFCMSCDIPARSLVLNSNQHNGEYSCPKCLHSGCNFRTQTGGNIRVYPYQVHDKADLRKHETCVTDARAALQTGKTVHGIKGPSFMMFCPEFDFVRNIGIDYMHLLYLGLVRLLVNLWFGVSYSLQEFSLYKCVDIVDSRINSIKPSHYVSRQPRNITDHLKFWKAAEFRSWFFYYSIPCIMDLMKPKYFYHYCALIDAIFLLNQASISEADIEQSERLLNYFVFMMPVLYGDRYMTLNVHSLLHLPKTVKQLGPLWSFSCFSFESANGELLKLFHGTQYIDIQIFNAVHVFQLMPSLTQNVDESSPASALIDSLMKTKANSAEPLFGILGNGHNFDVSLEQRALVYEYLDSPMADISLFGKANVRGIHFHPKTFSSSTCRNSYTAKYIDKHGGVSFGFICWFGKDDRSGNIFSCISMLDHVPNDEFKLFHDNEDKDECINTNFMNLELRFIHCLKETGNYCIVPLKNVLGLYICIETEDWVIACEEPNHQEINL